MSRSINWSPRVGRAVAHFWQARDSQSLRQGASGNIDRGTRSAVTGGKQMDGFVSLVRKLVIDAGISAEFIHSDVRLELPGYFRPEKKWDLVVVRDGVLLAALEFKSQIGPSFGNNFNNRSEEAIGSAQDIWTAYREGAFSISQRPWLGYLMLLEDCPRSTTPVSLRQPHFPAFPEFHGASYAQRYQLLMTRLVRERLYDSACFLMSAPITGMRGKFIEPKPELAFAQFARSLSAQLNR